MQWQYCKHVICQMCKQHWAGIWALACRVSHASVVRGCVLVSASFSLITSGFSNTITLQQRVTTSAVGRRSCHTHENCMHAEQIIILFYIFIFIFCPMYLVLFSVVFTEH